MKESFNSIKKEELNKEKIPTSFYDRLYNLREYIKTLPDQAKRAGFIAVLFSMGAFNITEAQNNNSDLEKTIKDLESGKNLKNVTDSIYSAYKDKNRDLTVSYVEYSNSFKEKKENVDVKVSGPDISVGEVGDTVFAGNYEAREYSVVVEQDKTGEGYQEEGRYFSAIKPYTEEEVNILNKGEKVSYKSEGSTAQAAIISAIAGLASIQNIEVTIATGLKNVELSSTEIENNNSFVQVICSETSETILSNVRYVLTKTAEGFLVEAFCN